MPKYLILLASLALMFTHQALAGDASIPETLKTRAETLIPGAKPDTIQATPIKGIYQVAFGAQIVYMSADGNYLLTGNLINMENKVNLTEAARMGTRKQQLADINDDQLIVYTPKDVRHTIDVFTDIDCPYCRKFHDEMAGMLAAGIKVRYFLFPRAGVPSASHDTAVSVWCAEDRNAALDAAKGGKKVEAETCDNPVQSQYRFGQLLGVTGTPAIITSEGSVIGGYRPAKALAETLNNMAMAHKTSAVAK